MTSKKNCFLILGVLGLTIFGVGCKTTFTVENGQVPRGFAGCKDTLLVGETTSLSGTDDRFVLHLFETYYHGPYRIIDGVDINSYAPEQYRFRLYFGVTKTLDQTSTGPVPYSYSSAYRYGFSLIDKRDHKIYGVRERCHRKLLKRYVVALEHARQGG